MNDNYPSIVVWDFVSLSDSSDIVLKYIFVEEPDSTGLITKLNQIFADGGNYGGYAPVGVKPEQSSLHCSGEAKKLKSGIVSSVLKAEAIDLNAFQILRNMAGRLLLDGISIKKIEVEWPHQQKISKFELPVPDENNEEEVYPGRSEKIAFSINWEDSDFGKSRRVLVEMSNPLESDQVHILSQYVKPWFKLLEAGGFAMPVGPPHETDSIAGRISQFDEFTSKISVNRFQASETAWNVLINSIGHYSEKVSPVSRIIID
jgi:hypothetical protein